MGPLGTVAFDRKTHSATFYYKLIFPRESLPKNSSSANSVSIKMNFSCGTVSLAPSLYFQGELTGLTLSVPGYFSPEAYAATAGEIVLEGTATASFSGTTYSGGTGTYIGPSSGSEYSSGYYLCSQPGGFVPTASYFTLDAVIDPSYLPIES